MRFVAVKSEAQQAAAMAYRTRDLLVRQRTQTINALRAHLAEQGVVAPVGPAHVGRLAAIIDGDDGMLPVAVRDLARLLLDQIAGLDVELRRRVTTDDAARRLTTIPGVGAVTAAAITTFAPPMETFSKGRDFAAWIGLTPRQHSSGGKDRLGRTSKMGQRDIRRLLQPQIPNLNPDRATPISNPTSPIPDHGSTNARTRFRLPCPLPRRPR